MALDLTKIKLTPENVIKIRELMSGDIAIIADKMGLKAALKIHKLFAGTCLRIAKLGCIERTFRDKRIRADFDDGLTGDALAKKYKVSARQIWNNLGK